MIETITGISMAILTLSEKDAFKINDAASSLTNDIFKIQRHNAPLIGKAQSFELLAPFFNLLSMIQLNKFDYFMPMGVLPKIQERFDQLTIPNNKKEVKIALPDDKLKFSIMIRFESIMEVNNKKFLEANEQEQFSGKNLFIEHYKKYFHLSTDSFEYKNAFDDTKNVKLSESVRTIKDDVKNVLSTLITKLGFDEANPKVRNEYINDQHKYIISGKSQSLFTTIAKDFFSLFVPKDENTSGLDAKFNPLDGVLTINSGKVKLGAGVELVEATGEVKVDPTPVAPVAAKPTQIEQPKPVVKPKPAPAATPVAPAKPTPAPVAKPEPVVSKAEAFLATVAVATEVVEAVDADEDEQAMLDELPDDL